MGIVKKIKALRATNAKMPKIILTSMAKDAGKSSIIKIANKVTTIANIIFIVVNILQNLSR